MINFEESQRLLSLHVKQGPILELPLLDTLGLALAKPISARADSPRFNSTSVDGYAISLADFANSLPVTLPIVETINAGARSSQSLKSRSAMRILTGAPVPKGADAVVMQEHVTVSGSYVTFTTTPKASANIRYRGAELKRGARLFEPGTIITPSVAQALAACGYAKVRVHKRPTVTIIVTGDELRTPGTGLKSGEIWDSNTTGLNAALSALGITDVRTHHVSDNLRSTTKAVRTALERSDVVIATGGVSVGDRDFVKEAFAANGVRELFWRVSLKPGKPMFFGTKRQLGKRKYVFGLPGNPVSVMVTYQLLVRRALLRMMGQADIDTTSHGILASTLKKSDPRTEFVRAYRDGMANGLPRVVPQTARDSHMTTGMAKADCLIVFPLEQTLLEAGAEVNILPIIWVPY